MKKFTLLLLLLAFVYSCQKSENPAPEENEDNIPPAPAEIVISDNYLPLTQQNSTCTAYDTLSGAVEMYISDTTLVPKMGNVIVVDLDTLGAIRRITSVENLSSGSYRFTTEHATMGDIFEKGIFALSTSNEPSTRAGIPVFKPVEMIYREKRIVDGVEISAGYYVVGIGTCKDKEIIIPSEYQGKPVVAISCLDSSDITSVTVLGGV